MTKKNDNTWQGIFKSAPRPLMMWVSLPLIPYLAVQHPKLAIIPTFALIAGLYGIRAVEKVSHKMTDNYLDLNAPSENYDNQTVDEYNEELVNQEPYFERRKPPNRRGSP